MMFEIFYKLTDGAAESKDMVWCTIKIFTVGGSGGWGGG